MNAPDTPSLERRISALASKQHGVVTRRELLKAGLTPDMVDWRVQSGRLQRLHRGVYLLGTLVGPLEPPRARETAAALACGPSAHVSHQSAGSLLEVIQARLRRDPVHVTVPGADRGRRRQGIIAHRVDVLPLEDRTVVDGIPVTAPARTLVDLASRLPPRELEQALAQGDRASLVTLEEVAAALERRPGVRGAPLLRRLLGARRGPAFTRSAAEERFLALVRKGSLPPPRTNARVGQYEVDFLWPSERVVVEVDGFQFHSARPIFEGDRRRGAGLAALGLRVVRVTWQQLTDEPHAVLARLAQTLALARDRSDTAGWSLGP